MNLKNRIILEDYRKELDNFIKLGDVVYDMLREMVDSVGMSVLGIEHRVKKEASLAGKLEKNSDLYSSLEDLTDILGARIICFFNDEIDMIGKLVEEAFVIDWENSCDKRALIKADTFGYLSLHYICSLPDDGRWPPELCNKKFEIQIRTTLQHTWSAIEHDLGYKSQFGVPREVSRQFARLAGLLELADDEFVRARNDMHKYTADTKERIKNDEADNIQLNMISLKEYLKSSKRMAKLLDELAALTGAEVSEVDSSSYIPQLKFLGIDTLGKLRGMIADNTPLALRLAEKTLANADYDIISSTLGLRFLCRAYMLNNGFSEEQAAEFLKLSFATEERAKRQARYLFSTYEKLN